MIHEAGSNDEDHLESLEEGHAQEVEDVQADSQ